MEKSESAVGPNSTSDAKSNYHIWKQMLHYIYLGNWCVLDMSIFFKFKMDSTKYLVYIVFMACLFIMFLNKLSIYPSFL